MSSLGKRTKVAREGIDREKLYPLTEAVKMVKERAKAKFDETIEVAIDLGIDPRHADQTVRGVVNLPNGSGRSVRVAVFARGVKADEAKAAGADVVGAEDLVEKVQGGAIDFDRVVATPDLMPLVGRLGKVLGPRGLMPNPKVGTVTMDVTTAVKGAKGGSVEFRAEKAGVVQAGVGKASFSEDKLIENIRAFADAVARSTAGRRGKGTSSTAWPFHRPWGRAFRSNWQCSRLLRSSRVRTVAEELCRPGRELQPASPESRSAVGGYQFRTCRFVAIRADSDHAASRLPRQTSVAIRSPSTRRLSWPAS